MTFSDTGTQVPSVDALKAQAKRLRAAMAEKHTPISHSTALEAVAKQWGFRDWNTLSATANAAPQTHCWHVGQRVRGKYLGHMFRGHLKAVSLLSKGMWKVTVVFDTAVDVVDSPKFSAFRKQVNARINEAGVTHEHLSNGTPHLELLRS